MSLLARAVIAVALASCHPRASAAETEMPPVRVTCAGVTRDAVSDARTLRGTVVPQPDRDAIVAPQIPGRVLRVLVREGDMVRAGAILAEIESQSTRDALTQARSLLAQAQALQRNAAIVSERSQRLFDRGIAARQEVDDAQSRRIETAAATAAAQASVDLAARSVARAVVRAPVDGAIVRVLRRSGELVDGSPATPVVEIADPAALEFLASASPADLVVLHRDQLATVRFDALPGHVFDATVRAVSPAIDAVTGLGSVRLTLRVDRVRPPLGLFGVASVTIGSHVGLRVPADALRGAGDGAEVVVCDGVHARVRRVETGVREGNRVEIVTGLTGGETVVSGDAVIALGDGASIAAAL